MVEMHVEGLSLDPQTRKPIVILRQNDGKGLLPLWIGAMEAMTISLVLNGEELPRPLAHDLLLMVAKALNGTLTSVDIVDYRDDIYYAVLLLRGPSGLISVDCRPSDGIALALRASVPIRVKTEVFEKAAREQEPGSIHPGTRPVPMPPPTWPAPPTPARRPTPWPPCWPKAPCPKIWARPPGRNGCATFCGPWSPYRGTRCRKHRSGRSLLQYIQRSQRIKMTTGHHPLECKTARNLPVSGCFFRQIQ